MTLVLSSGGLSLPLGEHSLLPPCRSQHGLEKRHHLGPGKIPERLLDLLLVRCQQQQVPLEGQCPHRHDHQRQERLVAQKAVP